MLPLRGSIGLGVDRRNYHFASWMPPGRKSKRNRLAAAGWCNEGGVDAPHPEDGSGFRVQGSGFRVQGSGFRVQGKGRVVGGGREFGGRDLSLIVLAPNDVHLRKGDVHSVVIDSGLGGVPREQKMLKGHLPRVLYHPLC